MAALTYSGGSIQVNEQERDDQGISEAAFDFYDETGGREVQSALDGVYV